MKPWEEGAWELKLEVKEDARNIGGLTIYGTDFGNYYQDIECKLTYSDQKWSVALWGRITRDASTRASTIPK